MTTFNESNTPTAALRIHGITALAPGPRLLVLGAVHGNETCGSRAIERVLAEFDSGAIALQSGSVTFVPITNPLAYRNKQRMGIAISTAISIPIPIRRTTKTASQMCCARCWQRTMSFWTCIRFTPLASHL